MSQRHKNKRGKRNFKKIKKSSKNVLTQREINDNITKLSPLRSTADNKKL